MVAPAPKPPLLALVDELLAEQAQLQTPVVDASRAFVQAKTGGPESNRFTSLIPLSAPQAGEQYAFEVDLDACSGCKSCVSACHALNGLDERETWRDTGQLHACANGAPVQQTITSACHHCADPGCLNGCPVLAYEKDPRTGIVRHLDDQCIGCQYCVLKCPYDVPKYNARLGIVRKCDLCHQRLAVGEAPACAQACPTRAIRITLVPREPKNPSRQAAQPSAIPFPGPDPTYTQPTTRYVTMRAFAGELRAADAHALRVQPTHWPLVLMLTLLPWAIALQAVLLTPLAVAAPAWLRFGPLLLGALGLAAATFHLGQPLRAWRVFLGWRKSWFSREALLFGAWFGATALVSLVPAARAWEPFAALIGGAGLVCSVMIYVDTRRRFWRAEFTAPRFLLGGPLLAFTTFPAFSLPIHPPQQFMAYYAILLGGAVALAKLAVELLSLRGEAASALLQRNALRTLVFSRFCLVALAVACVGLSRAVGAEKVMAYYAINGLALGFVFAGEVVERVLFFRAVDAPKMPGYAHA